MTNQTMINQLEKILDKLMDLSYQTEGGERSYFQDAQRVTAKILEKFESGEYKVKSKNKK